MPIFSFPDDAAWNEERRAVEFGVEIGEYKGRVFVPRSVFQLLLSQAPTPEACIEAFHLERTRFERAVEAKLCRRELSPDGNLELRIGDLRG
jgi:hypothetical protein